MEFHVCWFQAETHEARAIKNAATAPQQEFASSPTLVMAGGAAPTTLSNLQSTKSQRFGSWTHLMMADVDGMDLNELERQMMPRRKGGNSSTGGKVLVRGHMMDTPFIFVSLVDAQFIQKLAALDESSITEFALEWAAVLSNADEVGIGALLGEMAAFARQAEKSGKSVLQLDVL